MDLLQTAIGFPDHGPRCKGEVVWNVLLHAASTTSSIHQVCRVLQNVPSDQAIRDALADRWASVAELVENLNAALASNLPKRLLRREQIVAIDLTKIPFYGKRGRSSPYLSHGLAERGASYFYPYATAYVVLRGHRFTAAFCPVRRSQSLSDLLRFLLDQLARIGIEIKLLLLDRAFFYVEVLDWLQQANVPFLMPVVFRGHKPAHPEKSKKLWQFLSWKKSGWAEYWCESRQHRKKVRLPLCIFCRQPGKGGRRRKKPLIYAYHGYQPRSPAAARQLYRHRFGIETSYRQMNQCRIRTSSRNALLRTLCVGLALLLRNVWVWLHCWCLSTPRGGGLELHLDRLRFRMLLGWLRAEIEKLRSLKLAVLSQLPMPP